MLNGADLRNPHIDAIYELTVFLRSKSNGSIISRLLTSYSTLKREKLLPAT